MEVRGGEGGRGTPRRGEGVHGGEGVGVVVGCGGGIGRLGRLIEWNEWN